MDIPQYILGLLSGLPVIAILAVLVALNPEKVEKWSALLWRTLSYMSRLFKGAHKEYLRHDLQGRINEFVRSLQNDAPYLASTRVRLQWIGNEVTRKSFLEAGDVIIRLRRDDSEETNFVHGAHMFVSTSLLFGAKRYISPSQRKALDLFVTTRLLEQEKPSTVAKFLDDYLHPELKDPGAKVTLYYDKFSKIDHGGYFYPVLLQELEYLGQKVFGARKDDRIVAEVSSLIDFLEPIATREIGQSTDLDFTQQYCRFGIVIVGKSYKITPAGDAYINFIKGSLIPQNIETIYVLGLWENRQVVQNICKALEGTFDTVRTRRARVMLRYGEESRPRDQFVAIIRKRGVQVFQPSEAR